MKTPEAIKEEFKQLPGLIQEQLLDELLSDFENRGQVLDNTIQEIKQSRIKKPCPHCESTSVYKRGSQNGQDVTVSTHAINGKDFYVVLKKG